MSKKNLIASFENETLLLKALKKLQEKKVNLVDIYGPFATHDILKRFTVESRLPYAAVVYGIMALVATFSFIYYTSVIDYPLIYGGKPHFSFPPMVVIMFLVTILTTTILCVLTFHGRAKIFPGHSPKTIDPRITDDTFVLVVGQNYNPEEIKEWLKENGATDIYEKDII
jgi:hypothetical protein